MVGVVQQKIPGRKYQQVVSEDQNLKHLFIVMLSAYSDDPQNRKLTEESSVGKTAIVVPFIPYFPKDDVITSAGFSKKALYYDYSYFDRSGHQKASGGSE